MAEIGHSSPHSSRQAGDLEGGAIGRIRPKADGRRDILSWIQVEWKPTCVLPFLLIETVRFIPAMPSAIQMREDVAQLYSQFNFVKVICRVHPGDQRRQMFLCVFKFTHEPSPLDWRALFVYHCRSVGLSSHYVGMTNDCSGRNLLFGQVWHVANLNLLRYVLTGRIRPEADV